MRHVRHSRCLQVRSLEASVAPLSSYPLVLGLYFLVATMPGFLGDEYTPAFLPGKFHGQRSLVGYSPWGHKELDTTEQLHFHFPSKQQVSFNFMAAVMICSDIQFSSSQSLSHVRLFVTPWTAACQVSLFITSSDNRVQEIPVAASPFPFLFAMK